MVHVCDVPNSNSRTTKDLTVRYSKHLVCIHWLTIVYWVPYVDVGQLVQLDNLLLISYPNINWIYPLYRCCSNLNRGPSYVILAKQFHFTGDYRRQLIHKNFLLHKESSFSGLISSKSCSLKPWDCVYLHSIDYATYLLIAFEGLFMLSGFEFEGFYNFNQA